MWSFFAQDSPIIVKIVETPQDPTGLAGVLLGALGITGVLAVLALAFGIVMAGVLYFVRSRRPLS